MPLQMGEKIALRPGTSSYVQVTRQLGEGGFSYVFLAEQPQQKLSIISDLITSNNNSVSTDASNNPDDGGSNAIQTSGTTVTDLTQNNTNAGMKPPIPSEVVLKVTSIHSREARDIVAKEVTLLRRLNHPNIVKLIDVLYVHPMGNKSSNPLHSIALEYCNGGTALDVVHRLREAKHRFHWQQLIIIFGQIANAVTYMHAQKPPIVHRDLKLENFVVHHSPTVDGRAPVTTYKLCDFGSAVIGHIALTSNTARLAASDIIEKTTSPLYRAPEMCDIYMSDKLTEKTDVWALGCCLYSLAFCKDCFEEKSNLAIISGNYKIPDDNQYGDGMVELISRMLTVDPDERCDMPEVISCLSALYAKKPLPKQRLQTKTSTDKDKGKNKPIKIGSFRTDGQGFRGNDIEDDSPKLSNKIKILNPNSAAARRREKKLAENATLEKTLFEKRSNDSKLDSFFPSTSFNDDLSNNFEEMPTENDSFRPLKVSQSISPRATSQEAFDAFNTITIHDKDSSNDKSDKDITFDFSTDFDNPTVSVSEDDGESTQLISKPTSDENIATGVLI